MKKSIIWVVVLMLVVSLCLVGCGESEAPVEETATGETAEDAATEAPVEETPAGEESAADDTTGQSAEEAPVQAAASGATLKMGFIFNSLNNVVFVNWKQILEEVAPQYNFELTTLSSDEDPSKELSNMEDLINAGCDVIGISATDTEASKETVKLANDAGVPVFTLDRTLDANCIGQWITDNRAAAALAGQTAVDALGADGGTIAIVRGIYGLNIETDRYEGFMSVIDQNSNVEVVHEGFGNFVRDDAYTVTEDILTAQPDVDLIYCLNAESVIGCVAALEAAGIAPGEKIILGYDGTPEELEFIENGWEQYSLFQVFGDMLPQMIRDVRYYMEGGNIPILSEYSGAIVTQENLDRYWYEVEE